MKSTSDRARGKRTKKAKGGNSWAKAKTRNGKSRNGSSAEAGRRIEALIAAENWPAAREAIQVELLDQPADHWLWIHLGLTYYEQRDYEKAEKCYARAVELAPRCPLALWHYAGCLDMLDRPDSSLVLWTILLNMEVEEVAYGDHGEGMEWALELINDVHYRMGRLFQRLGDWPRARVSFEKYLHNRRHGVASSYELEAVEKFLEEAKRAESVASDLTGQA